MSPRVTVITGGGGGVGLACAHAFGADHALVLADTSAERLDAAATTLGDQGLQVAACVVCDVRDPAATTALATAAREVGDLAVLLHTAGLSPSMADAWTILDVNLHGSRNVLDAFLPLARPGTVAVCVASIAGHRLSARRQDALLAAPEAPDFTRRLSEATTIDGHPGVGYALSKRGVQLLVERRARAWGRVGARLVSVSPGLIADTPMGRLESTAGAAGLSAIAALDGDISAHEVAAACALLAAPEAAAITGVDLRVDRGVIPGFAFHAPDDVRRGWDEPAY